MHGRPARPGLPERCPGGPLPGPEVAFGFTAAAGPASG